MIYPIVKFGNPVLEKPAEKVTVFDKELDIKLPGGNVGRDAQSRATSR